MKKQYIERNRGKRVEEIDMNYVDPKKERELRRELSPYLKTGFMWVELEDNAPQEIIEKYEEFLKYWQTSADFEDTTGEEWH